MKSAVDVTIVSEDRQRDARIAALETIGCALASLRRIDAMWCDKDIRTAITAVRSTLSVAQAKVKERIEKTE